MKKLRLYLTDGNRERHDVTATNSAWLNMHAPYHMMRVFCRFTEAHQDERWELFGSITYDSRNKVI